MLGENAVFTILSKLEDIMRWKKLFIPVENFEEKDAKKFMADHREGTYTLLDVRQPKEYEQSHIPGAMLIPLPELSDRLSEVDPAKPVIVYCAIGGRSRAAAQLISGNGFDEVYNLQGGIKAYNGDTVAAPVALGEIHLTGNETLKEVLVYIHAMEAGLEKFYTTAAESIPDPEASLLLEKLAGIETRHKDKLYRLYTDLDLENANKTEFETAASSALMEGGFNIETFLTDNREILKTREGVLDIAMMLETHGLDLYMRYAHQAQDENAGKILLDLAEEEKAHLAALGRFVDKG
jgi:sulfur-carrier protein adenylyltransferase/sulfurtransferase